jgi:dsRNA-specific ribonuclease
MDYMKKLKDLCNERGWTVHYLDRNELQGDNRNEEIWTQHIVVNGTEKATGRARNKRMARNNAAEKLYRRLTGEEGVEEGVESSSSAGV